MSYAIAVLEMRLEKQDKRICELAEKLAGTAIHDDTSEVLLAREVKRRESLIDAIDCCRSMGMRPRYAARLRDAPKKKIAAKKAAKKRR